MDPHDGIPCRTFLRHDADRAVAVRLHACPYHVVFKHMSDAKKKLLSLLEAEALAQGARGTDYKKIVEQFSEDEAEGLLKVWGVNG